MLYQIGKRIILLWKHFFVVTNLRSIDCTRPFTQAPRRTMFARDDVYVLDTPFMGTLYPQLAYSPPARARWMSSV